MNLAQSTSRASGERSFDGQASGFRNFRFQFTAYCGAVDADKRRGMEEASMSGSMRQGEADRSPQLLEKKCRLYRALSNEEVSESLKVAVVHKTFQDAGLWKHLLRSAATLDSFPSIKDEVVNYGLAEAAARRTAPTDDDQVNLVECKGKMGRERGRQRQEGQRLRRRTRGPIVRVTSVGASTATGWVTSSPTVPRRKAIDDKKKSDSRSSSSSDNVMLGTIVATARENESSDELWIFALAVSGSLGSGNGAR